ERRVILDPAAELHTLQFQPSNRLPQGIDADQVDEQIRCQIAAGDDHVTGELRYAHRPPDPFMDLPAGIPAAIDPIEPAVRHAHEAISDMDAGLGGQVASFHGVEYAE